MSLRVLSVLKTSFRKSKLIILTASRTGTLVPRTPAVTITPVIDYMPHPNDDWRSPPNIVLPCETGGRTMSTMAEGPVGKRENDWTSAETAAGRNVSLALRRGFRGRCPRCGRGGLFCAFLKVADHCSVCNLDFSAHRADDLPAYLVIVIVGHILVPVILWIEMGYAPSLVFQLAVYLPITVLVSIALLQPVKGAVVALQWSLKMHGFGANPPDEPQT
jgi:uncharacterized protein (DUF983 family)